jgi:tetratricopeptide (TPR) repeat protein
MKAFIFIIFTAIALPMAAQTSELNPTRWGVVLDSPQMKNVSLKKDVTYLKDERGTLSIDIYSPTAAKQGEKRPAVIFLNAIGDQVDSKVKDWGIYSSWPRLIAANGMVGISMDADGTRIQESLSKLFAFLEAEGAKHGVDPTRLGVYAASANTSQSIPFLMGETAPKGIKAAALYYGMTPGQDVRLRKDLPVLFILAEGDMAGLGQQALPLWQRVAEAKAPWTLMFASGMIHAFDAFQDDDESRRIVMQTISFWKTHLEPVPQPSWEKSAAREIVAATYGNDHQRTADLLTKYVAKYPNDPQAHVFLARSLGNLGKTDESVAAFEKAVQLAPTNMFAVSGLGQARFRQRRYQEAETLLTKAVAGNFRNSMIYGQLAYSQLALNKNEEAIRSYESAFEVGIPPGANTRGLAYFNMACAFARLKNVDKAFEKLGKAVDEGYVDMNSYEKDEDLASLRSDARYKQIKARLPKGQE